METSFIDRISDRLTHWIGSTASLLIHTILFALSFLSHWIFGWGFSGILLVLTTILSLEAIYISIFIQRSVNQQAERLEGVEESIDDVEEALDDVEEALDDAGDDAAKNDEMILEMKKILKAFQKTIRDSQIDSKK